MANKEHDSTTTTTTTTNINPTICEQTQHHVILFYKFHPLSGEREIVELYRCALENLCRSLNLQGRILVGCNEHQSEGINGTLSGSLKHMQAFTQALTKRTTTATTTTTTASAEDDDDHFFSNILETFWKECDEFYERAKCKPLIMEDSEFKGSTSMGHQLFPDLNIKIVNELIGTGGVLAPIPLTDVHQGYLTPQEWHDRIAQLKNKEVDNNDTILIDCRNTKEWQIGHFPNAIDPNTTTFNQFPHWVQQHSQSLANKKVLMYCTGGIRCEKASAYIRNQVPSVQEVCHLKGGIHMYLDEYGSKNDNLWMGKNFVFDGRVAQGAGDETTAESSSTNNNNNNTDIVGSCNYCSAPFDSFDPGCVCTVCREPTLVCHDCRAQVLEFHCKNHQHLKTCYFTNLSSFSTAELQQQLEELQTMITEIAVGKKFRQKRKTLYKQCDKIMERLEGLAMTAGDSETTKTTTNLAMNGQAELKCRNCGEIGCPGRCWGFHGLKRKRVLETKQKSNETGSIVSSVLNSAANNKNAKNNAHLQEQKQREKEAMVRELKQLKLAQPPSMGRDPETGMRVPTPCTRTLRTKTKGKWCGMPLLSVLREEFSELSDMDYLSTVMERGLLRVNNEKITTLEQAENLKLKNMDVVSRIVHWHEPPVHIPADCIGVQKMTLPKALQEEFNLGEDALVYVCHKPSSVPVHPAGPYLSNSLTILVEAQEGLEARSLIPCHRIDRVTSGMTLCCTNVKVARMLQGRIDEGSAQKQYLAQVVGKFPQSPSEEGTGVPSLESPSSSALPNWSWTGVNGNKGANNGASTVLVDAPIETVDPANGIRKITPEGKSSQSLFEFMSYDATTDTSIISCTPLTGRSHQLRVHLQYLGFPIVKDVLYGGGSVNSSSSATTTTTLIGVDRLKKSIQTSSSEEEDLKSETLSTQDVTAAKEICPCCNHGDSLSSVFTPAQLLQGGHEICLHAFRYRIPFRPKKKKTKTGSSHEEEPQQESPVVVPVAVLDFQVGVPDWVPESLVVDLAWPSASKKDMKL
jgi:predicted sulfurtransferase/23S rRNA-/tRNA-specific pseudouridylate synthase